MHQRVAALMMTDPFAMQVLAAVRDHGPQGAYVAAGFVRNRFWDALYPEKPPLPDADIDVVYFDACNRGKAADITFETNLDKHMPTGLWQVRNQARMHKFGGYPPFDSLDHVLRHWAETATTVGLRLTARNDFEFVAPFGFDDLRYHILRITPMMKQHDRQGFDARLDAKGWLTRWPNLEVIRD